MKKMILTLLLTTCQIVLGIQDEPLQYRVSLQFIELPHTALTEMLASNQKNGQILHEKAMALSKTGQGKILESSMVVCRSGQRAAVESTREVIFPTEYAPPGSTPYVGPKHPALRHLYAFEPRNTGVTFQVEATTSSYGMVELRFAPEIVTQVRLETWMEHVDEWGDASMRTPIFECLRLGTSITLKPGKFEFVSALTPKMNAQGPVVLRKILVFVRADLLTSP